jgi:hypothetical protein
VFPGAREHRQLDAATTTVLFGSVMKRLDELKRVLADAAAASQG